MINIFPNSSKTILVKIINIIVFSIIFWIVGIVLISNALHQIEKYTIKNYPRILSALGITEYLKTIDFKKKLLILSNNPLLINELSQEDERSENYTEAYEKMLIALELVEIHGNKDKIAEYKERVKNLANKVPK